MPTVQTTHTPKIAFIRPAAYPLPNRVLPEVLKKAFPEYPVEIFDVLDMVKARPLTLALNFLAVLWEYGPKIAARHIPLREAFYTTRYLSKTVQRWITSRVSRGNYAFTFQIQSLFDASTGLVPHFVYTDHTHLNRLTYPGYDQRKLRPAKWIEMERAIYRHAAVNFTRSENISRSLTGEYQISAEKVVFAGVGSNLDTRQIEMKNEGYRNQNILFVGIDWERKGGPELLKAFELVLAKYPAAKLTIVGCSPEVRLPNCETVGKIPSSEVGRYFQQASIFCLPTKNEPFGVAFIDALYYRLPIVGTNLGAIPDFVKPGENGYLVEPGEVEGLARALEDLLDDPQKCREFGERGYALAQANYSWESGAGKISLGVRKVLANQAA